MKTFLGMLCVLSCCVWSAWADVPSNFDVSNNAMLVKDPGPAIDENRLDEGCLKADSVTIVLNPANTHAVLNWWAPQPGIYRIYSTVNTNNDGNPPGLGWTLLDSVVVVSPSHRVWTDNAALDFYRNYVLVHSCPVPSNDNCANAITITAGSYAFSTIGATTDGPAESQCLNAGDNQVGHDIWFRYLATCSGPLNVSLCGSHFDTKVALYATNNCPVNPNTAVSCNDDACGLQSQLTGNVLSGFTYLIRVGGYGNNWGTGTLTVSPGYANDECGAAISVLAGSTNFVTNCATTDGPQEYFNGVLGQITGDLWFLYTATACGIVNINTCGSGFDTKLAIYSNATCPTADGTALQTSDDICGQNAQTTFYAISDSVYLIRVGGHNGAYGSGTLTITPPTSPSNDDCANAISIGQQTMVFSTTNACTDGPYHGSNNCYPQKDLWYSYTAPYCGTVTVDLCGSSFDTEVAVYHGTCGNLGDPIACNDDYPGCSTRSRVDFLTTDQGPYLIRVGGYNAASGSGAVTVSQTIQFLTNDACPGAYTISYGTDTLYTNCAGTNGDTTTCGQIYHDLWFKFFPPANTTTTISTCGSNVNTRLAVYYSALSDCDTKSLVVCNDDFCGTGSQVQFSTGQFLLGGYWIRVGGNAQFENGMIVLTRTHN
jgi:hypothetical protein